MSKPSRKDRSDVVTEPELPGLELAAERPSPEEIVAAAEEAEGPVIRRFCLFSGGDDSTVTAHRCIDLYDELAFIDTGTALPGVREHIEAVAERFGKPLRILEAGEAYRVMVLGDPAFWEIFRAERREGEPVAAFITRRRTDAPWTGGSKPGSTPQGFPGPNGHKVAYSRLKQRQVERLVREVKAELAPDERKARVMLITGARRRESQRRMRTQAGGDWRRSGNQLWVNPLNDWSSPELRAYHRENGLPRSDVTAMIHRSGECNCGAYAGPEERRELEQYYPDWVESFLVPLEAEAAALGIPRCKWGERNDTGRDGARGAYYAALEGTGEMCTACDIQQLRLGLEAGVLDDDGRPVEADAAA